MTATPVPSESDYPMLNIRTTKAPKAPCENAIMYIISLRHHGGSLFVAQHDIFHWLLLVLESS